MELKYKLGCLFSIILFALLVLVIQQLTMSYIEIAGYGFIIISFFSLALGIYMYKYIMSKISSGLSINEEEKSNGTNKKEQLKKLLSVFPVLYLYYCFYLIVIIQLNSAIMVELYRLFY